MGVALSHLSKSGAARLAIGLGGALLMVGCASAPKCPAIPQSGVPSSTILQCHADAGDKRSALALAKVFERGGEGLADTAAAAHYYRLAATDLMDTLYTYAPPAGEARYGTAIRVPFSRPGTGIPEAQLALASLYATGEGVERDLGASRFWAERALRGGELDAASFLQRLNALELAQ